MSGACSFVAVHRGIVGGALLLPPREAPGGPWPCTLPVPMESLQNHFAGINEKCGLVF